MTDTKVQARRIKHAYTSTACLHDLHERCRLVCKFCDTACRCPCHLAAP